jgi:hypothetical protein
MSMMQSEKNVFSTMELLLVGFARWVGQTLPFCFTKQICFPFGDLIVKAILFLW